MVSCSDDDNLNSAAATVAFGDKTYSIKESKGIFTIPVNVEGEMNGPVQVEVEVTANSANCKEDVHYLVTSKHIVINPEKKQSYIEVKSVDDRVINDDRQFTLTITKAQGAEISSTLASTSVTLRDNDDIPYERMAGKWTLTANGYDTGMPAPMSCVIDFTIVDDESDPTYGSVITTKPWPVYDFQSKQYLQPELDEEGTVLSHPMTFHHDAKTGKTTVDMRMGTYFARDLDFGYDEENKIDLHTASIRSATNGMGGLAYSGTITGEVNEDFTEIKFNSPLNIIVFSSNGVPYMFYSQFDNIVFKLKN